MWLLHARDRTLYEFFDYAIPSYAILSHTWGQDEASHQDLFSGNNKTGAGYRKIERCCDIALEDDFDWVWIDTCCIDKKSSAELSEAINAMFRWYQDSARCYAYLSDVEPVESQAGHLRWPQFKDSRWFTRGWTLQELLAPSDFVFVDSDWNRIGTRSNLMDDVQDATGIPRQAFKSWRTFSVAQRMSWTSKRQTSRVEDLAYCLLGLFDVKMPLLYGEGQRAFWRLQEEIIRTSDDESIFVWSDDDSQADDEALRKLQDEITRNMDDRSMYAYPSYLGFLLAPRPSCFTSCGNVQREAFFWRKPYSLTNRGLKINTILLLPEPESYIYLIPLNCSRGSPMPLAMCARPAMPIDEELSKLLWMRSGWGEIPGPANQLFQLLFDPGMQKHTIYISAQWPYHPLYNMAHLEISIAESDNPSDKLLQTQDLLDPDWLKRSGRCRIQRAPR